MSHKIFINNKGPRLSQDVMPLIYDLYLQPDLNKGTFLGEVSIIIKISHQRKFIILHQKKLIIKSVILKKDNCNDNCIIEIQESYPVDEHELFIIILSQEVDIGLYNLHLSFSGLLQNKIVGFYSSMYKDEENRTRIIATSKFEPTYARACFPCFDEPSFKAEFIVKLVHPNRDCYSALSNMNIKRTLVNDPSPGLTTVEFVKSVPMSTYLACFIISDFEHVSKEANGLEGRIFPISVYTTKAQVDKGLFALDIGKKIIEYYIHLFNIDYPLPKLDMVAIPDFVSGAMENWGLVTYREARLLFDKKLTSTSDQEDIIQVISHEFAHMWFGNLVTMAWWNDLWLNEGFATFMQFKSSDAIFPEWRLMDHFLIKELHPAFTTDAKLSSHSIVQIVSNSDEINSIFDVISYQKGASILRMLENFVGTDVFYSGVTKYLKKFSYQNAKTDDLFNLLQSAVDKQIDIKAIMDTWTKQMGYPVVNVRKYNSTYILTQKRFLSNPNASYDSSESIYDYKWSIPITYITSEESTPFLLWFHKHESNLKIEIKQPISWIKFNINQIGYYRINYDPSDWESLIKLLHWSHKRLSIQDRTSLLEDAFSLAAAGELDYALPLNMTGYLVKEKDYCPWHVAAQKIKFIDILLSSTTISSKYREYIRNLIDGRYHDVTWIVDETEEHDILNLRYVVLDLACVVGHIECLEEAGSIFKIWINDEKDDRPHPDIRTHVYYYGMHHTAGETEWNVMFKRFMQENNASEKMKLMHGLAGIRSSWILQKYINLAMDENYIRSQDALNCLKSISNNPEGASLVWDWVRENWPFLVERYTLNDRYLGQLVPAITKSFSSKLKLNEMLNFFDKFPEAGAGAIYRSQAIETVETNIQWLERNREKIESWLDLNSKTFHIN